MYVCSCLRYDVEGSVSHDRVWPSDSRFERTFSILLHITLFSQFAFATMTMTSINNKNNMDNSTTTNMDSGYMTPVSSVRKSAAAELAVPATPRRSRRTIGIRHPLPAGLQMPHLEDDDDKIPAVLRLRPRSMASNYFWFHTSLNQRHSDTRKAIPTPKRRPLQSSLARRQSLKAARQKPLRCESCNF